MVKMVAKEVDGISTKYKNCRSQNCKQQLTIPYNGIFNSLLTIFSQVNHINLLSTTLQFRNNQFNLYNSEYPWSK